jgi:hypothetical protein
MISATAPKGGERFAAPMVPSVAGVVLVDPWRYPRSLRLAVLVGGEPFGHLLDLLLLRYDAARRSAISRFVFWAATRAPPPYLQRRHAAQVLGLPEPFRPLRDGDDVVDCGRGAGAAWPLDLADAAGVGEHLPAELLPGGG